MRNIYLAYQPVLLLVKLNRQLNIILSSPAVGKFAELSSNSFNDLEGKKLILVKRGMETEPIRGWRNGGDLVELHPISQKAMKRDVAALDSSVIQVAETDDGAVYAAKASVAFNLGGVKNSVVVGPSIIYVGDDSVHTLLGLLEKQVPKRLILSDPSMAMRMIRVMMERVLAREVSTSLEQGLILLDGSLKPSIFEPRGSSLKGLVERCDGEDKPLAGFCKSTKLKVIQGIASQLFEEGIPPSYSDITAHVRLFVADLLGRSYLSKLTTDGVPFRVDITNREEADQVLSTVVASDVLVRGYPETLRASHFLSIFSEAEEAVVKSQLARKAHVTVLPSDSLRKTVLGPLTMSRRRGAS
jgi:hypothetical protein